MFKFYLQNGKNRSLTRQHFQLAKTTLTRWVNQYNHSGIKGLVVLGKKRIYSPEFKLAVIQAVKNGLFPKPKGHPTMKPKYPKMPQLPKTEEERYPKKSGGSLTKQKCGKSRPRKVVTKAIST